MGVEEAALVRRLNARLRKAGVSGAEHRTLVKELLVHQNLARRRRKTPVTLPPAVYPWAEEVTEEWLTWVAGSGVDVVGDVTDLRPVAPAPGTPWVNPDRPKQKVLARAALEGLAVMTAEAPAAPTPSSSSPARSPARSSACATTRQATCPLRSALRGHSFGVEASLVRR